jgi:benzoyl-CoA reductase subunit C
MNRTQTLSNAVQEVIGIHRNRFDLWRAVPGVKAGCLSIDTPEEILLAAEIVPFRMTGESESDTIEACARLSPNYCSYVLSCLGEGLAGAYDFADIVIFTDSCDMRKRLSETWARELKSTAYFVDLPNDATDISKEYFTQRLRKLIGFLEPRYGCSITDDALRRAIALCNTSRRLIQRLYEYKKRDAQMLTGMEYVDVVKAATTGLKELFNERMIALLEALDAAVPPPARKRPRVMISGSYFDHAGIVDVIENAGADLVCEDISNGIKYCEGQVALDGDPVEAIASYYLERNTSARRLEASLRVRHMLDLMREYRAGSLIYYTLKFCDTNLHDYPYVLQRFKEEKIPVLFLEAEHNGDNIEGAKTRIQTFIESRMFEEDRCKTNCWFPGELPNTKTY